MDIVKQWWIFYCNWNTCIIDLVAMSFWTCSIVEIYLLQLTDQYQWSVCNKCIDIVQSTTFRAQYLNFVCHFVHSGFPAVRFGGPGPLLELQIRSCIYADEKWVRRWDVHMELREPPVYTNVACKAGSLNPLRESVINGERTSGINCHT